MKFFKKNRLTPVEQAVTEFEYNIRSEFAGQLRFRIEDTREILRLTVSKLPSAYYYTLNHYTIGQTIIKAAGESGLTGVYEDKGSKYVQDGWEWVFTLRGDDDGGA
ncbi:MAG: hypothetical protein ACXABY_16135 [Candidatus Thorarchaeota archaeon]